MIGFVLAAGFGTRLKPLTDHLPKALVPVCGAPVLSHILNDFKTGRMDRIGVNSHYLHEQLVAYQATSSIEFELFHEADKIRGTGGAFDFARSFLETDDSFCVRNVDIIADLNFIQLKENFVELKADVALVVVPSNKKSTVYYDSQTKAYQGTAPHPGAVGGEFIGTAFYSRRFLESITADDFSIVPVWARAIAAGLKVCVIEVPGLYWNDIGTPAGLAQIHFDVLDKKCVLPIPAKMIVDYGRHVARHSSLPNPIQNNLGEYCWIEPSDFSTDKTIARCIVMEGSTINSKNQINNTIFTPWGAIPFEL